MKNNKQAFVSTVILVHRNCKKPFTIDTDASDFGIGGIV